MREFFFELAALDKFDYPLVNMNLFTDLCFKNGKGYLKAIYKPIPVEQEPVSIDPALSKSIKSNSRRSSLLSQGSKEPEEEQPKELYTVDLKETVCKILNNRKSKKQLYGEHFTMQG